MQGLSVFRSRFFWKLCVSFAALLALTGLLVDRLVGARIETALSATMEAQLSQAAHLLEPYAQGLFARPPSRELQAEVQRLGLGMDLRITLVLPDGRVLADSHQDASRMENHGSRPEILRARAEGSAVLQRHSRTLGVALLYVAQRLEVEGRELGTLRLSWPVAEIAAQVAAARRKLFVCLGAGLATAFFVALLLARQTSAPIVALTRMAGAIRDGAFDTPVPGLPHGGEVGELADTLRGLGAEVSQRIATISEDDAQLRAMLAGMVEGVFAVDDEDRVLFSNGAARRLLRLDGSARARRLWEQAPNAALEELIQTARHERDAVRSEIELHRSGKELVIQAHASPFEGGGRSGVVVVVHDVSDLRRLENIRRDFVANVSHELKTPLAAIKGFVETLLGGALRDEQYNERFLTRIDVNVDRLTHLVTDLLSLARIESQEGALELLASDWRDVIESVLRRHTDAAEKKGLVLLAPSSAQPVVVLGDREAMTQVLDNLVDNAIKYTSVGRVEVTLEVQGDDGVLRVRDSGLGIPAADLDRIFERFYRVDKARSRELGGTGLGLSIVKHLVLSMGGRVSVESEPGKGSVFAVRLPLAG